MLKVNDPERVARILAHLEEQWPDRLRRLMKTGKLEEYLESKYRAADRAFVRILEKDPNVDQDWMDEVVMKGILEDNPDEEEPLSDEELEEVERQRDLILGDE